MKFLTHDGLLYFWQKVKSMIGNTSNLSTGTNLVEAVNQCFQNVSNGKELVASTLTDKGITTSSDATFDVINTNINQLSNTSTDTITSDDVIETKTFHNSNGTFTVGTMQDNTLISYGDDCVGGQWSDQPIYYSNSVRHVENWGANSNLNGIALIPKQGYWSGVGNAYMFIKDDTLNDLGVGSKMNIYTQMNEPTEKEGVWIQDGNGYNSVVTDGSYYTAGSWLPTIIDGNIDAIGYNTGAVTIGDSCYFIGLYGLYKYTPSTDTYQTVCSFSTSDGVSNGSAICAVGTNIYIFGGYYQEYSRYSAFKIDTLNNSKTSINYISYVHDNGNTYGYGVNNGCGAVSLGTDIYIMGSNVTSIDGQKFFKYNTLTDTYSEIKLPPSLIVKGCSCVVGTDIYIFSTGGVYKYDTINCNYTSLQGLPFTPISSLKCVSVGNEIYIIGGTKLYKYITNINSYVYVADTPMYQSSSYQIRLGRGGVVLYQSKILFFGDDSSTWGKSRSEYTLVDKQYNNGTVVVLRSDETQGTYKTQFFTSKINTQFGRVTSGFNDVAFYYDNVLHNNLPTYYGNGTSWVQIK